VEPAPALWIEAAGVREEIASVIEVSLPLPAAEAAARSAEPRAAQAAARLDPAAAGALPVLAVLAAVEVGAAAAGDGGK
jgi:hypothetical protein